MGNWTAKVLVFIAAPLLAQNTNLTQPVVVLPKADNSQTGELRFRELNTNGVNYIGFKAPTTLAANLIWELPALDGAANDCIVTNGSGVLSFAPCGGGGASLPVVDSTAIVKGSSDATKLMRFEVDGLTTATTRVLTIQDADHTVAGLEIGQTFTVKQNISESRSADFLFMIRNMAADGYAAAEFRDNTDTKQAHFGWSNSGATLGPSSTHISSGGPIRFYYQTGASYTEVGSFENIGSGIWNFLTKTNVIAPITGDGEYPVTIKNTGTNGKLMLSLVNAVGTFKAAIGFQDICLSGCGGTYSEGSLLLRTPSTDKISFFTNNTRRMDIDGTAGITSFERLFVLTSAASANPVVLRNNDANGLVGVGMVNNSGAAKATFSWDNALGFFRIETFGADKIQFRTNSTDRMYIDGGGLRPSTANTLDMGASSLYWVNNWTLRTYAEEFKVVVTGGASLGFGTAWDLTATSGGANWMRIRDNAAGDYAYFTTAGIFGGGVREAVWYANLDPDADNTRDLGISGRRWKKAWLVDVDISGSCTGCGGAPPFVDSTAIIKGSADATKLLAFEVDGFPTATTRTLTPQNASYTIAGINLPQTFTATQNFQQINPSSGNTYDNGTTTLYWKDYFGTRVYAQELRPSRLGTSFSSSWRISNPAANQLDFYDESSILTMRLYTALSTKYAYFAANVSPDTPGSQDLGTSGNRWGKLWVNDIDVTNTIPGHVPTSRNINTSSPLGGGGALSGDLTLTCTTCVTTGSTSSMGGNYTITGNLYIRTFSGGNANCSGVADGWIGFRTDTNEIQMCSGGALKKVTLL